jgi:tetratricopeptide (TPR) repeat protein
MTFTFDNYSRKISDEGLRAWYEWKVFMDESNRLDEVESVEYKLHPTFPDPIVITNDRYSKFSITATGWGEFSIHITINLMNGDQEFTDYYLSFNKDWPYNDLGNDYLHKGKWGEAVKIFEDGLVHNKGSGDLVSEGLLRLGLGKTYIEQHRWEKANELLQSSLSIFEQLVDPKNKAKVLLSLGILNEKQNNDQMAIKFYQEALDIFRIQNDYYGIGQASMHLGDLNIKLQNFDKATKEYEESLEKFRITGARKFEGESLDRLGSTYAKQGDLAKALHFYDVSLSIKHEIGDRYGESCVLNKIKSLREGPRGP